MKKEQFLAPIFIGSLLVCSIYGVINSVSDLDKKVVNIQNPFVFFPAFLSTILAIYLLVRYYKKQNRIKRKIKYNNKVSIKNAQDRRLVKIEGTALASETTLIAPLTEKKCIFYQVIIKVHNGYGDTNFYNTILEDRAPKEIFISDGTGLARILLQDTTLSLTTTVIDTPTIASMDDSMISLLNKHNLSIKKTLGLNPSYRFEIGTIEAGQKIAVLGTAKWQANNNESQKRQYPKVLTFTHNKENPLFLSNDPKSFNP